MKVARQSEQRCSSGTFETLTFASSSQHNPVRIIRMPELVIKTGLSKSHWHEKFCETSKNYDEFAPKKIYLCGTKGVGPVGFLESDVDNWIFATIEKQLTRIEK